jgi:hypothetical protein
MARERGLTHEGHRHQLATLLFLAPIVLSELHLDQNNTKKPLDLVQSICRKMHKIMGGLQMRRTSQQHGAWALFEPSHLTPYTTNMLFCMLCYSTTVSENKAHHTKLCLVIDYLLMR